MPPAALVVLETKYWAKLGPDPRAPYINNRSPSDLMLPLLLRRTQHSERLCLPLLPGRPSAILASRITVIVCTALKIPGAAGHPIPFPSYGSHATSFKTRSSKISWPSRTRHTVSLASFSGRARTIVCLRFPHFLFPSLARKLIGTLKLLLLSPLFLLGVLFVRLPVIRQSTFRLRRVILRPSFPPGNLFEMPRRHNSIPYVVVVALNDLRFACFPVPLFALRDPFLSSCGAAGGAFFTESSVKMTTINA